MKTFNVYDYFLRKSKKVKVFPTKKDAQGFELIKRNVKRALPFLVASAMCFYKGDENVGCGVTKMDKDYKDIYKTVVATYNLDALKEKEALPYFEVEEILKQPKAPKLTDFNYNHLPENQDNFWNIVRNGVKICVDDVQKSSKLSKTKKSEYKIFAFKMLSQISRYKGTKDEVDLSDYNNLKAFLYFENVVENKDNYEEVIKREKGIIDEKTEVFGRYYKDYLEFYEKVKKEPIVEDFAIALYKNEYKDSILSYDDSLYCNKTSYKILEKWMKSQKIEDKDLYDFSSVDDNVYCNAIAYYYKRGYSLFVSLDVDPNGDMGNGFYAPVGDVIIHELMHVMQRCPSSGENPFDNNNDKNNVSKTTQYEYRGFVDEISPTLMSLSIEDYLYKDINKIDQNSIVDYGCINFNGKNIKIGELAMWFRQKIEQNDSKGKTFSADKMLAEPKIFKELVMIANGHVPLNNTYNFNMHKTR